jgi:hypothetical protein
MMSSSRQASTEDRVSSGTNHPIGLRRGRVLWIVIVVALLAYLVPGPPGFATAYSLSAMIEDAEANGVFVGGPRTEALNRLALVYDARRDLRDAFGLSGKIRTRDLIAWALSRPDSSAASLVKFSRGYQQMLVEWDDPGGVSETTIPDAAPEKS